MAKWGSISGLEAHAGYWLRMVSNHVSHAFKLKVEAHGVTVAEWVVLRQLLDMGEVHPSQLAEKMGMTRGAISKLVDRLLAKSLVVRRAAGADRRYQSVKLAASGHKLVPVLAALADQNDQEFFGHLNAEQLSALTGMLKQVVSRRQLKSVPVD
jgi:MarR family transcriptional regulator, lower aerobic nicotinate degradation pathway regulator